MKRQPPAEAQLGHKARTKARFSVVPWQGHAEYDDSCNSGNAYLDVIDTTTGLVHLRFSRQWDQLYASYGEAGAKTARLSEDETHVLVYYTDTDAPIPLKNNPRVFKIPKSPMQNAGSKSLLVPDTIESLAAAGNRHILALLQREAERGSKKSSRPRQAGQRQKP